MEGELGSTTQGIWAPPIEPTQCRHGQNNAEITVGCKVQWMASYLQCDCKRYINHINCGGCPYQPHNPISLSNNVHIYEASFMGRSLFWFLNSSEWLRISNDATVCQITHVLRTPLERRTLSVLSSGWLWWCCRRRKKIKNKTNWWRTEGTIRILQTGYCWRY